MNNKPFSIILNETKQGIINIIREAHLHPILIEMILKELHEEAQKEVEYVSQIERERYEQQQQAELEEVQINDNDNVNNAN